MRPLVVVVTYNSAADIGDCIRSVVNQCVPCSIVIVDNASSDSTLDEVRMLQESFEFITLVASGFNDGFAKACNVAIRRFRAAGQPVLLLNPDCIMSTGSIGRLIELLDFPDVGAATLRLELDSGEPDPACARRAPDVASAALHSIGWRRGRETAGYNVAPANGDEVIELEATVGALMMIAGGCLDIVGLLDERFWMYGEDLDLCLRIRQGGWRIVQGGRPVVIHRKGRSSGTFRSPRVNYAFHRSLWLYYVKHLGPTHPMALRMTVAAGITARGTLSMLRSGVHVTRLSATALRWKACHGGRT